MYRESTKGTIESNKQCVEAYKQILAGMNIGGDSDVKYSGEEFLVSKIADIFENADTVFDVGANVGDYSLLLRKYFKDAQIHCFEPGHKTYQELLSNLNGVEGMITNNAGLGECEETKDLYYNSEGSTLASLFKRDLDYRGIPFEQHEKVDIITLDGYCEKNGINKIDYLKLDVEGNEISVLKGAQRMLGEKRIFNIQFEFGGANIDSRTYFRDFWNILHDNYDIYRVLTNGLYEIENYSETLEVFVYTNYFCSLK